MKESLLNRGQAQGRSSESTSTNEFEVNPSAEEYEEEVPVLEETELVSNAYLIRFLVKGLHFLGSHCV
jgi:hypothetical protein